MTNENKSSASLRTIDGYAIDGDDMPSLPLDVIDFIGRCNLYRENGRWYNVDGLFANNDVGLLQYIVELNSKFNRGYYVK